MLLVVNNLCRPDIGQSRVVEQLVHYLAETSETVSVLRAHSSTIWAQLLLILRIAVVCCTRKVQRIYYTPSRAPKSIFRDLAVYLASGLDGRRLVVHWHGRDIDIYLAPKYWHIRLCQRVLGSARHICIAEQQAAAVRAIWPDADIHIVPNVIEAGFLREMEKQLQRHVHSESKSARKQVVMIGNLMMSKGVNTFCQLARDMAGEPLEFHLYGPFGSDGEAGAAQVARLVDGHTPYVNYYGPVYGADKVAILLSADVFLFPSRYPSEALPLVVLEALAAGCYVISTDVGYLKEHKNLRLELIELEGEKGASVFAEALRRAPQRDNSSAPHVDWAPLERYKEQLLSAVLGAISGEKL